jgi:hypothetical protein
MQSHSDDRFHDMLFTSRADASDVRLTKHVVSDATAAETFQDWDGDSVQSNEPRNPLFQSASASMETVYNLALSNDQVEINTGFVP